MEERTAPVKKVFIATFGCQMNEYDSARVLRLLADSGYEAVLDPAAADFIFVNTCSIREKAEQKVHSYLGRLAPLKAARPDLVVAVGGCVAQQWGKRLLERVPWLDLVVGTHGINRLPEALAGAGTGRRAALMDFDYDLSRPEESAPAPSLKAHLTVMQGCDNFCAYCVVPYVRGREVSRPVADVLREADALLAAGVREITLLGQNVNSYGRGLAEPVTFADLLERVAARPGLSRLRFTTSHPKDLSPSLIAAFREIGPLCEHLHLPVQSGSDRVLAAMRRKYTRRNYLALVEALRNACPEIALTTDVIVGFPGETEEDFRETMDLVEEVRYAGMYSFRYSDRRGTAAEALPDKVPDPVKAERLEILQARQREISLEVSRLLIGREMEVLVEGSGRRAGQLTGRARDNRVVNFDGPPELVGRLVSVRVDSVWPNSLKGALVSVSAPEQASSAS